MHIRPATPADAFALARVNTLAWQTAFRGIMDDGYLDGINITERATGFFHGIQQCHSRNRFLVAQENSTILGYVFGGRELKDLGEISCEIKMLYVLPGQQGKGIGRALMLVFAKEMITQEATDMILWTLKDGPANKFYRATGAVLLDTTRDFKVGDKSYPSVAYHYPSLVDLITRLEPAQTTPADGPHL